MILVSSFDENEQKLGCRHGADESSFDLCSYFDRHSNQKQAILDTFEIMSNTTLVNVDADTSSKLLSFIDELTGEKMAEECSKLEGSALVVKLLERHEAIFDMKEDKGEFFALNAIDCTSRLQKQP